MDSWPCAQLSLPEGVCQNWLCLKQPSKCFTIHIWFPQAAFQTLDHPRVVSWLHIQPFWGGRS